MNRTIKLAIYLLIFIMIIFGLKFIFNYKANKDIANINIENFDAHREYKGTTSSSMWIDGKLGPASGANKNNQVVISLGNYGAPDNDVFPQPVGWLIPGDEAYTEFIDSKNYSINFNSDFWRFIRPSNDYLKYYTFKTGTLKGSVAYKYMDILNEFRKPIADEMARENFSNENKEELRNNILAKLINIVLDTNPYYFDAGVKFTCFSMPKPDKNPIPEWSNWEKYQMIIFHTNMPARIPSGFPSSIAGNSKDHETARNVLQGGENQVKAHDALVNNMDKESEFGKELENNSERTKDLIKQQFIDEFTGYTFFGRSAEFVWGGFNCIIINDKGLQGLYIPEINMDSQSKTPLKQAGYLDSISYFEQKEKVMSSKGITNFIQNSTETKLIDINNVDKGASDNAFFVGWNSGNSIKYNYKQNESADKPLNKYEEDTLGGKQYQREYRSWWRKDVTLIANWSFTPGGGGSHVLNNGEEPSDYAWGVEWGNNWWQGPNKTITFGWSVDSDKWVSKNFMDLKVDENKRNSKGDHNRLFQKRSFSIHYKPRPTRGEDKSHYTFVPEWERGTTKTSIKINTDPNRPESFTETVVMMQEGQPNTVLFSLERDTKGITAKHLVTNYNWINYAANATGVFEEGDVLWVRDENNQYVCDMEGKVRFYFDRFGVFHVQYNVTNEYQFNVLPINIWDTLTKKYVQSRLTQIKSGMYNNEEPERQIGDDSKLSTIWIQMVYRVKKREKKIEDVINDNNGLVATFDYGTVEAFTNTRTKEGFINMISDINLKPNIEGLTTRTSSIPIIEQNPCISEDYIVHTNDLTGEPKTFKRKNASLENLLNNAGDGPSPGVYFIRLSESRKYKTYLDLTCWDLRGGNPRSTQRGLKYWGGRIANGVAQIYGYNINSDWGKTKWAVKRVPGKKTYYILIEEMNANQRNLDSYKTWGLSVIDTPRDKRNNWSYWLTASKDKENWMEWTFEKKGDNKYIIRTTKKGNIKEGLGIAIWHRWSNNTESDAFRDNWSAAAAVHEGEYWPTIITFTKVGDIVTEDTEPNLKLGSPPPDQCISVCTSMPECRYVMEGNGICELYREGASELFVVEESNPEYTSMKQRFCGDVSEIVEKKLGYTPNDGDPNKNPYFWLTYLKGGGTTVNHTQDNVETSGGRLQEYQIKSLSEIKKMLRSILETEIYFEDILYIWSKIEQCYPNKETCADGSYPSYWNSENINIQIDSPFPLDRSNEEKIEYIVNNATQNYFWNSEIYFNGGKILTINLGLNNYANYFSSMLIKIGDEINSAIQIVNSESTQDHNNTNVQQTTSSTATQKDGAINANSFDTFQNINEESCNQRYNNLIDNLRKKIIYGLDINRSLDTYTDYYKTNNDFLKSEDSIITITLISIFVISTIILININKINNK